MIINWTVILIIYTITRITMDFAFDARMTVLTLIVTGTLGILAVMQQLRSREGRG